MNTYRYIAKDKQGHTVTGALEASVDSDVAEALHSKELVVVSIEQIKKKAIAGKSGRIKSDDLVVFSRQLATMIDAGIPLVQSLGILEEQIENKSFKNIVLLMRRDIEGGMSFCNVLAKHPKVFSDLFINMVRAGEASGMLDEVLDRLATYLEKSASLNRKIRSSLVYPTVVVSMAILITAVLLLKVVPTFKKIFEILGGQLPLPTRILIGVSDLFSRFFIFFVGLFFVFGFIFKRYIDTEKGRRQFDNRKLKTPVLGPLFRKVAIAKFARTFSTLVKSGVTILNTLDIVAKTSGNKVMEESILSCRSAVRSGEPISKPLSKGGIFPPMVCRMISVGEQTGQLEKMLSKIADFYDDEVDAAVTALTSMIEPLIMVVMGAVIGAIMISMYLPMFDIIGQIK